jgi:poly [ADP-ribose] polymerase
MEQTKGDVKLIMVTQENNNKFYDMHDNGDGTFIVEWGRVGQNSRKTTYPISKWDRMYRNKINKGYQDVTEIYAENDENNDTDDYSDIEDPKVQKLVKELQSFANKSVSRNYIVSSENVTEKQVEEAQRYIDELVNLDKVDKDRVNMLLLDIYKIIPRRMNNVRAHLFEENGGMKLTQENLKRKIESEQNTLDVMRGQVSTNNKTDEIDKQISLLDAMGLYIENISDDDLANIEIMMGPNYKQFRQAFRVTNYNTENKFQDFINNEAHSPDIKMFWHGSRNENWWSILDSGLVLRPANAIITGKMFGYGIYFADQCRKSVNYTSIRGSYWARGNQNKGYISLFKVNTGNMYKVRNHASWMLNLDDKKLKKIGPYDSIFAEGGADLRNNEYVVYNQEQVTIKYIVEIGAA